MGDKYRVLHVMLNKGNGGMEEVFRQYNLVLSDFCKVISVIHKECKRKEIVTKGSSEVIELNQKFGILSAILHVRQIARKNQIDLAIIHDSPGLSITNFSFIGYNIKKISVRHTFFSSKFSCMRWKMKSDVRIVVNKKLAEIIGNNKTHVIYNSIGYQIPDNMSKKSLNKIIKIGFLGRLVQNKGVQFLVKALGLLRNKRKLNCELVIGGDGKYLKSLKSITTLYGLNDHVKFLGYVSDKTEFFDGIDVFCLPSLRETFGLVLLESMVNGIPIIASNISGIDEVVKHKENGILFNPGDHHDLAEKIEKLIIDDESRNSIIEGAFQTIQRHYTIERLRQDLHTVISNSV